MLKSFLISVVSLVVLDFLWLGFVVKDFNMRQLVNLGRFENGDIHILYFPAVVAYLLMAAAITYFVLPKIASDDPWYSIFFYGATMGLIVYGVYDMTNWSIIKDYPVPFLCADMAWGTFVFGLVTFITWKANQLFSA